MNLPRRFSFVVSAFLFTSVLSVFITSAADASAAIYKQGWIGQGTDEATPYYIYDSRRCGPTVLVVGGVHGNEFSGATAAEQIRSWSVQRGKLIVLPRANPKGLSEKTRYIPGETKEQQDLNRNFPTRENKNDQPRGELAKRIWLFVKSAKPDWIVDLHEGTKTRTEDPKKGNGNTVIAHSKGKAVEMGKAVCEAINKNYPDAKAPYVYITGTGDSYLASAAGAHLGAQTLIVETHRVGPPLSFRARQHRLAVYEVLKNLEMVSPQAQEAMLSQVVHRKEKAKKTIVGLYDAAGTGGNGVPAITKMIEGRNDAKLVPVGPRDIQGGVMKQLDVIVFPGGSGSKQGNSIGEKGREAVREFVKDGGGYIGICAGAYLATNRFSWGLKILDAKTVSPKWQRGKGDMDVEFTKLGQKLLKPADETLQIRYHNGPIIEPDNDDSLPDYLILGIFRTEIAEHGSPKGAMVNTPAIVASRYGKGRVLCYSPHAEGSKNEVVVAQGLQWVAP